MDSSNVRRVRAVRSGGPEEGEQGDNGACTRAENLPISLIVAMMAVHKRMLSYFVLSLSITKSRSAVEDDNIPGALCTSTLPARHRR